jgi:pimeloyl-ACP methyl ester carboxylesterase
VQAGLVSVQDGQIIVNNPLDVFYHDMPRDKGQSWASRVLAEPTQGWEKPITYMGWRDIASHYIICEKDRMLPSLLQEQLGKLAGSTLLRMDVGHFPHVSQPAELTSIIQQIATTYSGSP